MKIALEKQRQSNLKKDTPFEYFTLNDNGYYRI